MAKETKAQQKTVARVMREFKDGELESGPDGAAGKVKTPRQAIAIALSEAGVSNQKSPAQNARAKAAAQAGDTRSRKDLYEEARRRAIPNRSTMNKAELARALAK